MHNKRELSQYKREALYFYQKIFNLRLSSTEVETRTLLESQGKLLSPILVSLEIEIEAIFDGF